MAQAYTPGLKRKDASTIRKTRRLPIPGEVLVKVGDTITYNQVVARTELLGNPQLINVCLPLMCEPDDISKYMLKKEGDAVKKGELTAHKKGWFTERKYSSEFDGTIEYISDVTGQIVIREPPILSEIYSYIPGRVVEVIPKEGAVIECFATYIQGIFGVGGETHGELMMIAGSPDDTLSIDRITGECSGKVLVGGSLVTEDALRRAEEVGAKGVVVGGIEDEDLSAFLGYEIGVAITGHEELGLTLILTEGFGQMAMAGTTFELLKSSEGRLACINGATQIRAGVMRPEVIVPLTGISPEKTSEHEEADLLKEGMVPGTPVRVIGDEYFGALGVVTDLVVGLQRVETESSVRVLEAKLEDGRRVIIPRANVEIIEE